MRFFPWAWVLSFALAIPIGGAWMAWHALAPHTAPAPSAGLVQFEYGQYDSYGTPSFTVTVDNGNAAAVTVHTVSVRFTDQQNTAYVITDVTEQTTATVAGGQSQQLTFSAPTAVANTGVLDRNVGVTVTDWS